MSNILQPSDKPKFPGSFPGVVAPTVTLSAEAAALVGKPGLATGEKLLTTVDINKSIESTLTLIGGATATTKRVREYPDSLVIELAGLNVPSAGGVFTLPVPCENDWSVTTYLGKKAYLSGGSLNFLDPTIGDILLITVRKR
jgi:hypothetical protein